jgi:uncharacterized protein
MGNPVVHWELWSREPERVSKFYSDVFAWKISFMPEMNYRMVDTEGKGGINGGIMQPQEGPWPGNMAFYIQVDDLDAHRAKVVEAGGKVIVERVELPGMGAYSLFEDPEGRVLGMWQLAGPSAT